MFRHKPDILALAFGFLVLGVSLTAAAQALAG